MKITQVLRRERAREIQYFVLKIWLYELRCPLFFCTQCNFEWLSLHLTLSRKNVIKKPQRWASSGPWRCVWYPLCVRAHPWAIFPVRVGECACEEEIELFMERSRALFPFWKLLSLFPLAITSSREETSRERSVQPVHTSRGLFPKPAPSSYWSNRLRKAAGRLLGNYLPGAWAKLSQRPTGLGLPCETWSWEQRWQLTLTPRPQSCPKATSTGQGRVSVPSVLVKPSQDVTQTPSVPSEMPELDTLQRQWRKQSQNILCQEFPENN